MPAGRVDQWSDIWEARWPQDKPWYEDLPGAEFPEGLAHPVPEVVVDRAYREILRRPPDAEGFRSQVEQVAGGLPPFDLARSLAKSPEASDLPKAHVRRVRWLLDSHTLHDGAASYPPLLDESETGGIPFDDWLFIHAAYLGCTGRPPSRDQAAVARDVLMGFGREGLLIHVSRSPAGHLHLYGASDDPSFLTRVVRRFLGGRSTAARAAVLQAEQRILVALVAERSSRRKKK